MRDITRKCMDSKAALLARRLLRRRAFWVGVLTAVLIWGARGRLRPEIYQVPAIGADGIVTVEGKGFGNRQGSSVLALLQDGCETVVPVKLWSGGVVSGQLPAASGENAYVRVSKRMLFFTWRSEAVSFVRKARGLPSFPYRYQLPVDPESPWPLFRRDQRNTGASPIRAKYHGDRPWAFRTAKGIFSTPVIGGDGTVYVGSADHVFYAINPDATEKWRYATGELIDSAAALHQPDPDTGQQAVTFISGDGCMYHLRVDGNAGAPDERLLWTFDASTVPGAGYNNWWEGNVAVGYDGTIFAGNTNWNYYAVRPDGSVRWKYPTGNNCWSMAAFDDGGNIFWGALDTKVRKVAPDGTELWAKRTWGPVAASAAIGSDGTIYIGSFDSYFYALDSKTGATKWTFKTGDHIYSSAALGPDEQGNTEAIYFGSTDGIFYALNPEGECLWTYDTGDPIRSSPALGRAPKGETGHIVYFGSGNGVLYALNTADGSRRWSFDTTPDDPELRARNDLNASPALGQTGVYIAGEHGEVWYVPYDYPLHRSDTRAKTEPGEDLPEETAQLFYVTPGGSTAPEPPATLSAATMLTYRLVVREAGQTLDARMKHRALDVHMDPDPGFRVEVSADGHYVHIIPDTFLRCGTEYTVDIRGHYFTGGWNIGNLTLGGRKTGEFTGTFGFRASDNVMPRLPLLRTEHKVTAIEWTRLAVPLPPMLPSLNQIGFDYLDCLMTPIAMTEPDEHGSGKLVMWFTAARRDANGVLVVPPDPDLMMPLDGLYQGDHFIFRNRDFHMSVTGLDIPFNVLEMRGQLGPDLRVKPGATAYADTDVLSIPTFGPLLVLAGLANNVYEKLVVAGTFITRPYEVGGPANKRPEGISVAYIEYIPPLRDKAGSVTAHFELEPGASYPLNQHQPALVLVDSAETASLYLDYRAKLRATPDTDGNLKALTLDMPAGTTIPRMTKVIVMLDAFPFHERLLMPIAAWRLESL